jgi:hypothetical protein
MAISGRFIFSMIIAAGGAVGVGAFVATQQQPAYDPIVTGSNRTDPKVSNPAPRPVKTARTDAKTPNPDEVKAFFDSQLKQVRAR